MAKTMPTPAVTLAGSPAHWAQPTALKRVLLPKTGHYAHFMPRSHMKMRGVRGVFNHFRFQAPTTVLPVDSTGNGTVQCPMDDNDQYGDCGAAMADHSDRIWY